MTLLERMKAQLPIATELCTHRDGTVVDGRYAWFDPLSLRELQTIIEAMEKC